MTEGPEPISAAARESLERELDALRTERDAVAATLRGGEGEEPGDHADQADELERATERDRLDRRVEEIEARLDEATAAGPPPTDAIGVGSTVTVRFEDGTRATLGIGEDAVAPDGSVVTADSPLGRALLGHRVGDTVDYVTPEGPASAAVLSLGD